jgi:murein DD-endopeptidase MepM/ murein hydrolase activator NlpD
VNHQIDTSFRQRKQSFAAWRRQARLRRIYLGIAGLALCAAVTIAFLARDKWMPRDDLDEELQVTEGIEDLPSDAQVYIPAIVDLAGDPMWITLSHDPAAVARNRVIDRPAALAESGVPAKLEILADEMLSSSEQFMTTIPSNQEDFAFFQAQRSGAVMVVQGDQDRPDVLPGETDEEAVESPDADLDAGWDELQQNDGEAHPTFKKTEIENNTTVVTVVQEARRFEATEDTFVRILGTRTLESVVLDARFGREDAGLASAALKAVFGREELEQGFVVAMRGYRPRREAPILSLMQVSVYARSTYVGTLVRADSGGFEAGVDPWVANDLFNYSGLPGQDTLKRQYRLLDAIYSTAVRNNVPPRVIGEAIMYLSRGNDLNLFADESDRLVLVYSQEPRSRDRMTGRVLYVAVRGMNRNLDCYVYQQMDGDFTCASGAGQVQSVAVASGMATPVNGVLTSTFGPRKHPILKTVRLHKGVDWKAPVGTPIFAAFDGQIVYRGDSGGYGNLVRISHAGGRETRYAHMQRFADKVEIGTSVKAGTVIGYVGTTGLSTGPHLHFEVYQDGAAIDPLGNVMVAARAPEVASAQISTSAAEAVQILTNRIIHVESGGRATAKNPNSSATGLGQFISKTWIRMMNTYRPDLARSLSTTELLALRFDPTISREMVANLAREGEAYLKQRGHAITAGRLYLCHFLGMEGAHLVLSAPRTEPLINIIGAQAINANRFLTGKDASYVIDWAERKMRGARATAPVSDPQPPAAAVEDRPLSPEFEKFKMAVAEIVKALDGGI